MAEKEESHSCMDKFESFLSDSSISKGQDIKILLKQLQKNVLVANCNSQTIVELYKHASKLKDLKVIEVPVPSGILPSKYNGFLCDIKINGCGPDDKIYTNNKWIRENVTRGMSFLKLKEKDTSDDEYFDLVIYANKKFTGGVGDEDVLQPEDNDVWKKFCFENPDDATKVICMSKVNGEAGHLSGRTIDGKFYWIFGSKNVHMIVKNTDDIVKYSDSRYGIATIVAQAIMKKLNSLTDENLSFLKSLFDNTKMTAVFELCQPEYQHIVNLSAYLEPTVHLLMFTATVGDISNESFTAIAPHYGLLMGEMIGFSTSHYDLISVKEVPDKIGEIRQYREMEGCVLYYLTEDCRCIGLAKVKSVWYTMLRALREKVSYYMCSKNKSIDCVDTIVQSCHKRFKSIQTWLKINDQSLKMWSDLGGSFIIWFHEKLTNQKIDPQSLRPKFPIIWAQFLSETNSTDEIPFK